MTDSRTKNAALNIAFSILLQIVTFFRGLILPHIIIPAYGSDINGLISSITQFLAYISLLEAGVGAYSGHLCITLSQKVMLTEYPESLMNKNGFTEK